MLDLFAVRLRDHEGFVYVFFGYSGPEVRHQAAAWALKTSVQAVIDGEYSEFERGWKLFESQHEGAIIVQIVAYVKEVENGQKESSNKTPV